MNMLPGRNRRRRRRDTPRASQTFIRGAIVVAIAGAIGFFMLRLYNGLPTTSYETVYVSVPNIGNLLAHDAVRIGGKRVGQVLSTDLGEDGRPLVELQLDPGTQIPADTEVTLRANGLLGARFVELAPGDDTELLESGATISAGDESYTFGLPEFVEVFDEQTRQGIRRTIGELGEGFLANGEGLNATLETAKIYTPQFDRLMQEILEREGSAGRLLPALASAFEVLDRNREATGPFADATIGALGPFVTERAAVQDTLGLAPSTLAAAEDGLRRGVALLSAVRSFSSAAAETLPYAPAGLNDLSHFLDESIGPLRRLTPTLEIAREGLEGLTDTLVAVDPVTPRILEGAELARPIMAHIGEHECDLVNFGAVMRSVTGWSQADYGPAGPAMAFRLEAVAPDPAELIGVKDGLGIFRRDAYESPCAYLSEPYPQFADLLGLGVGP